LQEAVLKHAELPAALEKDLVLSGFGQRELDLVLGIAVGNQAGAGYTICEVGAGEAAFTKMVSNLRAENFLSTQHYCLDEKAPH